MPKVTQPSSPGLSVPKPMQCPQYSLSSAPRMSSSPRNDQVGEAQGNIQIPNKAGRYGPKKCPSPQGWRYWSSPHMSGFAPLSQIPQGFMHPFSKWAWSSHSVPDLMLAPGGTVVNQTKPCPPQAHIPSGRKEINRNKRQGCYSRQSLEGQGSPLSGDI